MLRRVEFVPGEPFEVEGCVATWAGNGESILDVTQGPDGKLWVATVNSIVRLSRNPNSLDVPPGSRRPFRVRPNPSSGAVSFVAEAGERVRSIEVLDVTGRRVRRLDAGAGPWTWDGLDDRGRRVPAALSSFRGSPTCAALAPIYSRMGPDGGWTPWLGKAAAGTES